MTLGPREVTSGTVTLSIHLALVPLLLTSADAELRRDLGRYGGLSSIKQQLNEQQRLLDQQKLKAAAFQGSSASRACSTSEAVQMSKGPSSVPAACAPVPVALHLPSIPVADCAALAVAILTTLATNGNSSSSSGHSSKGDNQGWNGLGSSYSRSSYVGCHGESHLDRASGDCVHRSWSPAIAASALSRRLFPRGYCTKLHLALPGGCRKEG